MGKDEESESEGAGEVVLVIYEKILALARDVGALHGLGTLPVGARVSGQRIVNINLGKRLSGSAWRHSHTAVL